MSVGYSLVDSVAMSDELWEFKEASDRLAQKFDAYADTLSDEEWEELEAHIEECSRRKIFTAGAVQMPDFIFCGVRFNSCDNLYQIRI